MEEMSAPATIDAKQYRKLLAKTLPTVITTEEQNERYTEVLEELASREDLTPEEEQLMKLLTVLIERFEAEHYQLKAASPVGVLTHLMDVHGLKQKDLTEVFGAASVVSEVIRGKRALTVNHIRKLSSRFNVSPEVFI